jgi:RNA polymerase sigma-70 factor (ECF subfamily)
MISTELVLSPSIDFAPPQSEAADASDYELAQRSSRGDRAAFEEIYQRHHRRVYSLCLRMTANEAEAEDLAQDVFVQLFRKIGSFRGEASFATWLHRLTVNFVLMHLRKPKVQRERTTEDGETPVQIAPGTQHPNSMAVVDRLALETAIRELPRGYRLIFLLHDVEGFQHDEIAAMLNCTAGTSKSQLHKARMKLRELINGKKRRRKI